MENALFCASAKESKILVLTRATTAKIPKETIISSKVKPLMSPVKKRARQCKTLCAEFFFPENCHIHLHFSAGNCLGNFYFARKNGRIPGSVIIKIKRRIK